MFSFSGTGTGSIPDGTASGPGNWGPPLDVSFDVNGLSGNVSGISVSMTFRHAYAGDVEAVLIPPAASGASPFVLFSGIGQQLNDLTWPGGSPLHFSSDANGNSTATYLFSDSAAGDLWAAGGFNTATGTYDYSNANIPGGSFRTSVAGPWDVAGNPNGGNHNAGQFTSFATDSGFVGLTPSQASGTWILRFRDDDLFDTGVVTAAELDLVAVPEPVLYAELAGLALVAFAGARTWVRRRQTVSR